MPDFHVVSLTYSMMTSDKLDFDNPPPLDFNTNESTFHLADAKLTCRMKVHFSTTEEARAAVEPVLRAWEVEADLRVGIRALRFDLESADVVNRTLGPAGVARGHAHVTGVSGLGAVGTMSPKVTLWSYPMPSPDFRVTPNVSTLYYRYQGFREGREPLQAMAYFCLTVLRVFSGGQSKAAAAYKIHNSVLGKLGELSSARGDSTTARKMSKAPMRALSGGEIVWIEEAIKQIIRRMGDQRPVTALPLITMKDLPSV